MVVTRFAQISLVSALMALTLAAQADAPQTQPTSIEGQVQAQSVQPVADPTHPASNVTMLNVASPAPLAAKDFLTVSFNPTEKRGRYQGVQYSLKNLNANAHLQVIVAEVVNGVDEAVVANEELQSKQTKRRIAGGLLRGLSAVPFASGLGYSSVGAYQAAAIGSHVANTAASTIEATADGASANIQGRYVRQFSSVVINPGETFNFNTLVLQGMQPQLKLVFKTLETNQVFDLMQ